MGMSRCLLVSKVFCTAIFVYFCLAGANGQFVQININHFTEDNLTKRNKTLKYETFLVPVPEGPSVKLGHREVIPEPDSIYTDKDGIRLCWAVNKHPDFYKKPPVIKTSLLVRRNNWTDFINGKYKDPPDPDTARHLRPEPNIQSDHEVITTYAASLKATTRFDKINKIYDAVVQTRDLDLSPSDKPGTGAIGAISQKTSRSYDYAALMTALCRASNIPARFVSGFTFELNVADSWLYLNHWVEVYFPGMGWVTFDPAGADIQKVTVCLYDSYLHYIPLCYGTKNAHEAISDYYKHIPAFSTRTLKSVIENFSVIYYIDAISEYQRSRNPAMENKIDSLLMIDKYDINFLLSKGMMRTHAGDFDNGLSVLQLALKLSKSDSSKSSAIFCMARYFALKKDHQMALQFLEKSFEMNKKHFKKMLDERDLKELKKTPEFKSWFARLFPDYEE